MTRGEEERGQTSRAALPGERGFEDRLRPHSLAEMVGQERLRENIKSGGQDELTNRWRNELEEAEQAIRKIEEERLPGLRQEEESLRSKLKDALKSLSVEWSEEG